MPARVILHIGAAKCGSSSLQTALSARPCFTNPAGERFAYLATRPGRAPLEGTELSARANRSPFGAVTCQPAPTARALDDSFDPSLDRLRRLFSLGISPILSCESWAHQSKAFEDAAPFADLGPVDVVLFIRPAVFWLNSAWWQWGVWTDPPVQEFIEANLPLTDWAKHIAHWQKVPGVRRVIPRFSERGVTKEFFALLGLPPPQMPRFNSGLPTAVRLFLLRQRRFRPGPHTPQIEFILARALSSLSDPTPWAFPPGSLARFLPTFRNQATALAPLLSPGDQTSLAENPLWQPTEETLPETADLKAHTRTNALAALIAALDVALGNPEQVPPEHYRAWLAQIAPHEKLFHADTAISARIDKIIERTVENTRVRSNLQQVSTRSHGGAPIYPGLGRVSDVAARSSNH